MQGVDTQGSGGYGTWDHDDVNGHSAGFDGEPVTYCVNEEGANMGHYYIECSPMVAPCGCVRGDDGDIGIHGGSSSGTTAEKMATQQTLSTTYGCIRVHNGCPYCNKLRALQACGEWHNKMQWHNRHIWIWVHD